MHKMNMIGQKRNVYQNSIAIKCIPMVKAMTIVTGNTVHAIPTPSVAIPSVVPLKYPPPTLVAVSDQNEKKFYWVKFYCLLVHYKCELSRDKAMNARHGM